MAHPITICINWHDRAIDVTGYATAGYRGSFFEPPCPPEFEIIRIEDEESNEFHRTISRAEREEIEERCLRQLEESANDDAGIDAEIDRRMAA